LQLIENMKLKKTFFEKKILITGHTGFKGSWLTALLIELGAKVIGVSIDSKKNSHFEQLKIKNKIVDLRADIRNLKMLKKIINLHKPEFIFHLAAQSLILKSFSEPIDTWTTNVIGTLNLVECLKLLNKKCFVVIITSDKCYLNIERKKGYRETDRLGGLDPYSASKASAEMVVSSEINSFFKSKYSNIKIATARAGNVIGGGDWSDFRIIPDCIKAIQAKKVLDIRNPEATRPWQHVLEPICAYLNLAQALKSKKRINGESFNFGPTKYSNKTVKDLLHEMKLNYLPVKFKIKKKSNTKDKEAKLLHLNCNKAKRMLGWESKLNFKETIKLTSEWYSAYLHLKNKIITMNQIKNFLKGTKK